MTTSIAPLVATVINTYNVNLDTDLIPSKSTKHQSRAQITPHAIQALNRTKLTLSSCTAVKFDFERDRMAEYRRDEAAVQTASETHPR